MLAISRARVRVTRIFFYGSTISGILYLIPPLAVSLCGSPCHGDAVDYAIADNHSVGEVDHSSRSYEMVIGTLCVHAVLKASLGFPYMT